MHDIGTEGIQRLHACAQHLEQAGNAAAGSLERRNLVVIDRRKIATMIRRHDVMHVPGAEARLLLWVQLVQVARNPATDRLGDVQHFHRLPSVGPRWRAGHRRVPARVR